MAEVEITSGQSDASNWFPGVCTPATCSRLNASHG